MFLDEHIEEDGTDDGPIVHRATRGTRAKLRLHWFYRRWEVKRWQSKRYIYDFDGKIDFTAFEGEISYCTWNRRQAEDKRCYRTWKPGGRTKQRTSSKVLLIYRRPENRSILSNGICCWLGKINGIEIIWNLFEYLIHTIGLKQLVCVHVSTVTYTVACKYFLQPLYIHRISK